MSRPCSSPTQVPQESISGGVKFDSGVGHLNLKMDVCKKTHLHYTLMNINLELEQAYSSPFSPAHFIQHSTCIEKSKMMGNS